MKAEQVKQLLACLGVKKTELSGQWVNACCPLAFATHKGGHDSNPSFGVNTKSGTFNCFSCGASGGLSKLVQETQFHAQRMERKGFDFKTAYAILGGLELELDPLPEYSEYTEAPIKPFEAWPEWWIDSYPVVFQHALAMEYLEGRGVSSGEMAYWDLRWDEFRKSIVYPYRNAFGKLAGARGRCIYPDYPKKFQHYDYSYNDSNNAQLVFFNEPVLQLNGPLIVVEGQMDAIKVSRYYCKVVANMTAKIGEAKLKKLSAVDQVVLMLDNDESGQMSMHGNEVYPGAVKLLQAKGVQVGVMDYPAEYKDPDKIPDTLMKALIQSLTG